MTTVLDNVKTGMGQTFTMVQGKIQLKNLLCNLRAQTKILERQQAEATAALGAALYEMHLAGAVDMSALFIRLSALDTFEERLVDKQREIEDCEATLYGPDHRN